MHNNQYLNKTNGMFKPKSNIPAFIVKTYEILENPENFDIISWNKEGTAFIVKNTNEFSEKILPKYFKHNNFSSFVRQLNMYDFHKSKQENKENEFRHRLFRRGQRYLLSEIKRKGSDQRLMAEGQGGFGKFPEPGRTNRGVGFFGEEVTSMRINQAELGKMERTVYMQNTQLMSENKKLWEQLHSNKEQSNRKLEKLLRFAYSIMDGSQPFQKEEESLFCGGNNMLPNIESRDHIMNQEMPPQGSYPGQQINLAPMIYEAPDHKFDLLSNDKNPPMSFCLPEPIRKSPAYFTPSLSTNQSSPANPNPLMIVPSNLSPYVHNYQDKTLILPNAENIHPPVLGLNNVVNLNNFSTTSAQLIRRETPKLIRPAQPFDPSNSEFHEFRANPIKIMKRNPEETSLMQNSFSAPNFKPVVEPQVGMAFYAGVGISDGDFHTHQPFPILESLVPQSANLFDPNNLHLN